MILKQISDLELKAMLVLWQHQTCCVHTVHQSLSAIKPTAYTTAQTILERLVRKGFALKEHMGKKSIYQPKISKQLYATSLTQALFHQLVSDFSDVLSKPLIKGFDLLTPVQKQTFLKLLQES